MWNFKKTGINSIKIVWILAFVIIGSYEVEGQRPANVSIQIEHFVGNDPLILDTVTYVNESAQPFTVSKFKYYIGNIKLTSLKGHDFYLNDYFLVNEDDISSKKISLESVPLGEYSSVSFIIGVDSIHNCSGIQSGALDPVKGMFWAWNTGYIFLKLEGHSPLSDSPAHIFEYHIGGFKSPSNCIRNITLNFPEVLKIEANDATIVLKADAGQVLKSPVSVDFSKLSSVTDFNNATSIADNYSDMFSILHIK